MIYCDINLCYFICLTHKLIFIKDTQTMEYQKKHFVLRHFYESHATKSSYLLLSLWCILLISTSMQLAVLRHPSCILWRIFPSIFRILFCILFSQRLFPSGTPFCKHVGPWSILWNMGCPSSSCGAPCGSSCVLHQLWRPPQLPQRREGDRWTVEREKSLDDHVEKFIDYVDQKRKGNSVPKHWRVLWLST